MPVSGPNDSKKKFIEIILYVPLHIGPQSSGFDKKKNRNWKKSSTTPNDRASTTNKVP